jgi:[ribosomal protein S5]-alanine N-acetyltransferase
MKMETEKTEKFITGERLYLRQLLLSDAKGPYRFWFNEQETCMGNAHGVFPMSDSSIESYINSLSENKNSLVLAIMLPESNIHIGNISLQSIDYKNRRAEMAIMLGDKNHWGKGYGLEACKMIIKHGFNNLNLHTVYCGTFSNNIGMQKIAKKLGMRQEGTRKDAFFKEGVYLDVVEYGILKKEWKVNQ